MREIKFRLYFREGKKLTYSTHTFEVTDKRLHIMLARFDENTIVGFVQFTGLHDKNGTPIFEGDLIRVEMCECVGHDDEDNEIWEDCEGPVSFEDGMFVFDGHSAGTIPLNAYIENVTVIGNIHQPHKP